MYLISTWMKPKTIFAVVMVAIFSLIGVGASTAEDMTQNRSNYDKLVSASENLGGNGSWVVLETNGQVEFQDVGQDIWQPVQEKTLLNPGAKIRAKADSWAFLSHNKDRAVLTADSELEIKTAKKSGWINVLLNMGSSLFDVNRRSSNRFQVETKYLVATVKGTTFSVNVDDEEATVAVSEGTVGVANRNGSGSSDVTAGKTGRAGSSAGVAVSASMPGDTGVAPPGWSAKEARGKSSSASVGSGRENAAFNSIAKNIRSEIRQERKAANALRKNKRQADKIRQNNGKNKQDDEIKGKGKGKGKGQN